MPHLSAAELSSCFSDTFHGLPSGIIFDCDGVVIDSREANITYYIWGIPFTIRTTIQTNN